MAVDAHKVRTQTAVGDHQLDKQVGLVTPKEVLGIRTPDFKDVVRWLLSGESTPVETPAKRHGQKTPSVYLTEKPVTPSVEAAYMAGEAADERLMLAHGLLNRLNPRHRLVMKLRRGIGTEGGREYTQDEVGKRLGVRGQRVHQIEAVVKKRLAGMADEKVTLATPDNRDVLVF